MYATPRIQANRRRRGQLHAPHPIITLGLHHRRQRTLSAHYRQHRQRLPISVFSRHRRVVQGQQRPVGPSVFLSVPKGLFLSDCYQSPEAMYTRKLLFDGQCCSPKLYGGHDGNEAETHERSRMRSLSGRVKLRERQLGCTFVPTRVARTECQQRRVPAVSAGLASRQGGENCVQSLPSRLAALCVRTMQIPWQRQRVGCSQNHWLTQRIRLLTARAHPTFCGRRSFLPSEHGQSKPVPTRHME
jgi:hypothetical protein